MYMKKGGKKAVTKKGANKKIGGGKRGGKVGK